MAELFLVALDDGSGRAHALGAYGERSLALRLEHLHSKLQLLLDLSFRQGLKRLDDFSGGGIDRGNWHVYGANYRCLRRHRI